MQDVKLTVSRLKELVESRGSMSYFFSRKTMSFFGDTMKNYGVRNKTVQVIDYRGDTHECYELYRKSPNSMGLTSSVFFSIKTLWVVIPNN